MMVFNDFQCPNGHKRERFVDNNLKTLQCDICDAEAHKVQASIRFQLDGVSGDYPTAADQWDKRRKQKLKEEEKINASYGREHTPID